MGRKKRYTSFEDLKSELPKKKKRIHPHVEKLMNKGLKKAEQAEEQPILDDGEEQNLFAAAMSGVEPVQTRGGREVAAAPKKEVAHPREEDDSHLLDRFVAGDLEFELEYTEEYLFGQVKGLDPIVWNRLKAGGFSVEGHVDLHGQNMEQAQGNLLFFLKESFLQGRRCVLVITGRGKNSPGGQSVLRRELVTWLTREPLRRVILAFCTSQPKDGGAGAVYVLLRREKKQKGKVKWDRMVQFDDL